MAEIPRLNGVIRALEQGKTAFVGFGSVDIETASALGASNLTVSRSRWSTRR